MTEGRKTILGALLLSCCLCLAVSAEGSSLEELLKAQKIALDTLEKKLAGRNPYLQWTAAQQALKTLLESTDNVARTSRRIDGERVKLAAGNQRLAAENDALLKEAQQLRRSNRELGETSKGLADGNKRLLVENEHLLARQKYLWMAFYAALALAFLGFGGLLVRLPNSRLEGRLKRLEIADLENKLKKEAAKSRAGSNPPRASSRPMAERRRTDIEPPQPEPLSAEPPPIKIKPTTIPEALRESVSEEPAPVSGAAAKEGSAGVGKEPVKPTTSEKEAQPEPAKRKRKKKKKKSPAVALGKA